MFKQNDVVVPDIDTLEKTLYHVVKRNPAGKILQDVFLTTNEARAEIYQRMYPDTKIETIRKVSQTRRAKRLRRIAEDEDE